MKLGTVALLIVCGLLGGCATMSRATQFGTHVASFHAGGKFFRAWTHPTEPTIMLQGGVASAAGSGAMQGLTFGLVTGNASYDRWMAGARWLADPLGCTIVDLQPVDQTTTWTFRWICPPGVDLRRELEAHQGTLLQGEQLPARVPATP